MDQKERKGTRKGHPGHPFRWAFSVDFFGPLSLLFNRCYDQFKAFNVDDMVSVFSLLSAFQAPGLLGVSVRKRTGLVRFG